MREEISVERLESDILAEISTATDERQLESVRIAALGKKGVISERMKELGALEPEARRATGALLNRVKERVTEALSERRDKLREA
ncbi:MAG TPA: phenylalanine--tRNA ligase subunit alpha, partial [Methyloceanibacter sp.]